eukprot:489974-Pyramimonas_sp.AAC.1
MEGHGRTCHAAARRYGRTAHDGQLTRNRQLILALSNSTQEIDSPACGCAFGARQHALVFGPLHCLSERLTMPSFAIRQFLQARSRNKTVMATRPLSSRHWLRAHARSFFGG